MAISVGGLFVPLLIVSASPHVIFFQDVDGPPPGMVFAGLFTLAAITTPFTLLLSLVTVRLIARREKRNVR